MLDKQTYLILTGRSLTSSHGTIINRMDRDDLESYDRM